MDYNGEWVCYNLIIASVTSTRLYEQVVAELERDLDYNIKCQQNGDKSLQNLYNLIKSRTPQLYALGVAFVEAIRT